MALITRQAKGSKLTIQEMDGNLTYLEELAQSDKTQWEADGEENIKPKDNKKINVEYIDNLPNIPTDLSELSDNSNLLFDGDYNNLDNLPTNLATTGSNQFTGNQEINGTVIANNFTGSFSGDGSSITNILSYSTYLFAHSNINPSLSTLYHVGQIQTLTPTTTQRTDRTLSVLNNGVIKDVSILSQYSVIGSGEGITFNILNVTKNQTQLITDAHSFTDGNGINEVYTLTTPMEVEKGDVLTITWTIPQMDTLPTSVRNYITINLESKT